MTDLIFSLLEIKDLFAENRDIIGATIAAGSSILVGVLAFLSGKRRASKSEFSEIMLANKRFREEVTLELEESKKIINGLQKAIDERSKIIDEMQSAIADLKQQLSAKETRISDMQMDIINKDYQIQMLKDVPCP